VGAGQDEACRVTAADNAGGGAVIRVYSLVVLCNDVMPQSSSHYDALVAREHALVLRLFVPGEGEAGEGEAGEAVSDGALRRAWESAAGAPTGPHGFIEYALVQDSDTLSRHSAEVLCALAYPGGLIAGDAEEGRWRMRCYGDLLARHMRSAQAEAERQAAEAAAAQVEEERLAAEAAAAQAEAERQAHLQVRDTPTALQH
jgi:hypothetical protein